MPTQTINLDENRSAEINFQLGTLTLTKRIMGHNRPRF